jgi:hypothetical protein
VKRQGRDGEKERENDSHIYLGAIAVKLNVEFMTDGKK